MSQGGEALLQELGPDKDDVEKVVNMVIKVSMVVSKDDETKAKACECADSLLKYVMGSIDKTGALVCNSFLVAMGLIKGEDKKLRLPSSVTGSLLVLEHIVKQSYFPKLGRDILLAFISKPHAILVKSSEAQGKLLQTLYGF